MQSKMLIDVLPSSVLKKSSNVFDSLSFWITSGFFMCFISSEKRQSCSSNCFSRSLCLFWSILLKVIGDFISHSNAPYFTKFSMFESISKCLFYSIVLKLSAIS